MSTDEGRAYLTTGSGGPITPAQAAYLRALPVEELPVARAARVPSVGFDADGVLWNFVAAYTTRLAATYPEHRQRYQESRAHPSMDFFTGYGQAKAEFLAEFTALVDAGLWDDTRFTIPGTMAAVRRLVSSLACTVHLITDRRVGSDPWAGAIQTARWVGAEGFPFTSVTISADKRVVATDFFIEDNVANYRMLREAGTACYVQTTRWNAHEDVPPEHRVSCVDEFVDRVLTAAG